MATKTFYSDPETDADIKFLAADFHEANFSAIVRMALHNAAETRRKEALRREALSLRENDSDRDQALALAHEMELISIW